MPPKFSWHESRHPHMHARVYRLSLLASDGQTMFWREFCVSEANLVTPSFAPYLAEMKYHAEMEVLAKCDEYEEMEMHYPLHMEGDRRYPLLPKPAQEDR